MTANGLRQPLFSAENKPLLWALLISVAVHAVALWLLFVLAIFTLFFSSSKQEALAQMLHIEKARARTPEETEPQLVFVQVDPTQASAAAPKNAKFYSSQNSVAANPDADKDTDTPKIDGKQTEVPKTETSFPLRPSLPKQTPPTEKAQETKPQEQQPKPGDLAMMTKPIQKPEDKKPDDAPQVTHERPHTIEEARMMRGDKMKEDGGVHNRRVVSSLDAVGSPFGEYDARIVEAITQHWYDLLDNGTFTMTRGGKVVIQFHLNYDGRITDMKVEQNDVGPVLGAVCESAIMDPEPYDRWPEVMYRKIKTESGKDYRDMQFTFYYDNE
jgi:hypothetical protein